MNFSELPQNVQDKLIKERSLLHTKNRIGAWGIYIYSNDGKRFFSARRKSLSSQYGAWGGGSYWTIKYGATQFRSTRDPLGGIMYELCEGTLFNKVGATNIPSRLSTKREVIDLINKIGKFDI